MEKPLEFQRHLARYHRAMLDDADNDAPAADPPNADSVYRGYIRSCKKLGIRSVPRERARKLIEEWRMRSPRADRSGRRSTSSMSE